MTSLKLIVPTVSLLVLLASCHRHQQTIVIDNGTNRTEMVRRGGIEFTADSTAIKSISPDGYLSYKKNEKRFRAERDKDGSVYMEVYDNGKQVSLDSNAKIFLAAAIKDMVQRGMGRITKD